MTIGAVILLIFAALLGLVLAGTGCVVWRYGAYLSALEAAAARRPQPDRRDRDGRNRRSAAFDQPAQRMCIHVRARR